MRTTIALLTTLLLFNIHAMGQSSALFINEFLADNKQGVQDEWGDYPDWIELYNSGNTTVNLNGYSLTDDANTPDKWTFPAISFPPDHYLLVFASGKDLYEPPVIWSTAVKWGDEWKYHIPNASTPGSWNTIDFEDASWNKGPSGFGYGDDDDSTSLAEGTISVYLRKELEMDEIANIERAFLHMDFDDGFVAYLNGVEIARENLGAVGSSVTYNALADNAHEARIYAGMTPKQFEVENLKNILRKGSNVLAIEVHNASPGSSDLTAIPFFTFGYSSFNGNPSTHALVNLPATSLHANFKLSNGGEYIGLYDANGVEVDEIEFGPQRADISWGRSPINTEQWGALFPPTPAKPNGAISNGFVTEPVFSSQGGIFDQPQSISLSVVDPAADIYYTLDGSTPDENSLRYINPISLFNTTVIRARAFKAGSIPSEVVTNSFFVKEAVNLPLISIVTDPEHLFSDTSGIYVTGTHGRRGSCDPTIRNLNQDWERPVNVELYETHGQRGINQQAGIKIFGGCSRTRFPQKSFSLFARSAYGKGAFDYQLFPDKEIYSFESFILRSSADDQVSTMVKDAFAQAVLLEHMDIDNLAYRPAMVFINGQYWGIHNIREKINEHYPVGNYGVKADEVDILQGRGFASHGEGSAYLGMVDYAASNNLNEEEAYQFMLDEMDIPAYIDYQIANIYMGEGDWPGNNIKFWRSRSQVQPKWRWIMFDRDQTFVLHRVTRDHLAMATATDGTGWPNPPWSTLLLRRLLTNETFRNTFIQIYAYHINTCFAPERIGRFVDEFTLRIIAEIPRHISKWGGQIDPDMNENWSPPPTFNSLGKWLQNMEQIREFAKQRPLQARNHLKSKFGLTDMSTLTINMSNEQAGVIKLYHKQLLEPSYTGEHFDGVPIELTAFSKPGYYFSHWTLTTIAGEEVIPDQKISFTMDSDVEVMAYFTEKPKGAKPILVINEINYQSSPDKDAGDWVEIYNPGKELLDIGAWKLQDGNDENVFVFPQGTEILPFGYLVICRDLDRFHSVYPEVANRIGNLSFNFSNEGEVILLYSPDGIWVDSVHYDNDAPWPLEAAGMGPSLQLKDPLSDNNLAINWGLSIQNGTPGVVNKFPEEAIRPPLSRIFSIYPNPVNFIANIAYELEEGGEVSLEILDFTGRSQITLVNGFKEAGIHNHRFFVASLTNGVYIVRMWLDGIVVDSEKMVINQ